MKIETMEPGSEISRPSAMERITTAAETAGRPRSERVMKVLDRILGAPEAAGMAVTIAGESARALQERAANALNEAAHSLEDATTDAIDQLTGWVTKTKDKGVAKAKDWGTRALKFGLTKVTWLEDRVVERCTIPADLIEKEAVGYETEAAETAGDLARVAAEQAAREMNLSVEQAAQLARILAKQAAERERMPVEHKAVTDEIQRKIDGARTRASELKADAAASRAMVEKRRVFKGLLARVSA